MEWLRSGLQEAQKQAQQAAEKLMQSEAAERARVMAQHATQQARTFAEHAGEKAREVAKEAVHEAEKGLAALRVGTAGAHGEQHAQSSPAAADPAQYGINSDLEQFVRSLTYSTFSDYPMETLPSRHEAGRHSLKLSGWQETHARLVLGRVPQLQDLRFVLCPRRMDEFTFWTIYFTLCKRYLPPEAQGQQPGAGSSSSGDHDGSGAAAAAGSSAAASAAGAAPGAGAGASSAGVPLSTRGAGGADAGGAVGSSRGSAVDSRAEAAGGDGPRARGAGTGAENGANVSELDDEQLAALEADPELDAYLQEALAAGEHGGGSGGGSTPAGDDADAYDLDEYLDQLDAEVGAGGGASSGGGTKEGSAAAGAALAGDN